MNFSRYLNKLSKHKVFRSKRVKPILTVDARGSRLC